MDRYLFLHASYDAPPPANWPVRGFDNFCTPRGRFLAIDGFQCAADRVKICRGLRGEFRGAERKLARRLRRGLTSVLSRVRIGPLGQCDSDDSVIADRWRRGVYEGIALPSPVARNASRRL